MQELRSYGESYSLGGLMLPQCNAPINCLPHYPTLGLHVGNTGGFDSVLNKRRATRVGNLTFDLIP